ncbi:MAG TPA: allantoate amidohydrolase [Streptosporangiaceae bacterium]
MTFSELWSGLEPIGRYAETGGYRRYSWTPADAECRAWFTEQARARGLTVIPDKNGNLWAWWGERGPGAVVTGSHLDSVPDGGAFDGPLGIVSGFAAIDLLRERGAEPVKPLAVTAFVEEEGARFGVACLGTRLLTGAVDPDRARSLTDDAGVSYADAMAGAGLDPAGIGTDDDLVGDIGAFVELHVEQGRALEPLGEAVGIGESIWPHGRWRLDFTGMADHAGTAQFADRKDPMLPYASTVLVARRVASERGALATFGKVIAEPGGANGVPSAVHAWLDVRAAEEEILRETVTTVCSEAEKASAEQGVSFSVRQESATPVVRFDRGLRERIGAVLGNVPVLPTGAGHDAGVLAARVPVAMLFVRNPMGVSHSPAEHADLADCEAGVLALAAVLEELACR